MSTQYLLINFAIYQTVQNTDVHGSLLRNPGPYHDFEGVLRPRFSFWHKANQSLRKCPIVL